MTTSAHTRYSPPGGAYLNGTWQPQDPALPVTDPETGTVLAHVRACDAADVHQAVHGTRTSLESDWPVWARREALELAARQVAQDAARFARIIAAEGVKTIREAEAEVTRCAETLRLSAAGTSYLRGQTLDLADSRRGGHRVGWYTREPLGVVAAITSFNDPLNLVAHKVGPALIAGNAVVLKPSEQTPLSAIALVQILLEAGVPNGRIALVCGAGDVGQALVEHPGIDVISFTGGARAAEKIARAAGPRKLLMELGGDNPTIICADSDPKTAAAAVVRGGFGVAGQNCLSVQRVYAHASLFDRVLAEVVAGAARLRVGSKADHTTDVGPLIDEAAAARVDSWVTDACRRGAVAHTGGVRKGAYFQPTVLTDVPADSPLLTCEVFGPVVTLIPFEDVDTIPPLTREAGQEALQVGVFTGSVTGALRIATRVKAGAVIINGTSDYRLDSMPFGGFGRAGIGREGVQHAIEAMSEPKVILIDLAPGLTTDGAA